MAESAQKLGYGKMQKTHILGEFDLNTEWTLLIVVWYANCHHWKNKMMMMMMKMAAAQVNSPCNHLVVVDVILQTAHEQVNFPNDTPCFASL